MRVAIISSPRCGNTFLRLCLADILSLNTDAFHEPKSFPSVFPDNFIFQLHWQNNDKLFEYLLNKKFKIITLARNPLDIFISILRFTRHEKQVENWLKGELNIKQSKFKLWQPNDPNFINWCTSKYSKKLLSVSLEWSKLDNIHLIRYEDLIFKPFEELIRINNFLDLNNFDQEKAEIILKKYDINYFKNLPNLHGWKGKVGNWKSFFKKDNAIKIYDYHQDFFKVFDYQEKFDYMEKNLENLK